MEVFELTDEQLIKFSDVIILNVISKSLGIDLEDLRCIFEQVEMDRKGVGINGGKTK